MKTEECKLFFLRGNVNTKKNSHPFIISHLIETVKNTSRSNVWALCLAMTATIGVTFGAGSAAKRILLFAINVTVLVSVNVKTFCLVFTKNVNSTKFLHHLCLVYILIPLMIVLLLDKSVLCSCWVWTISVVYYILQLLGLTCSVLCLYQVKLMPETYEVIVAAIQESNLTLPTPAPVTSLPSVTISKNNNNTTRTTKKGRPRVSRYVRTNCYANQNFVF